MDVGKAKDGQRKDGTPNWDEVLMQGICQGPKQAELCQGPTLNGDTQGKSGSRKMEEKRAGQGGKLLAVVMCLVLAL